MNKRNIAVFEGLSSFLMNPGLAIGAAAAAGPIVIHLLSRRRHRRIQWAAMSFLLEALRRNRRRVRMEQLILLALRCLAVLLIAAMIMRPFVRPGAAASLAGGLIRTERVILIDDSFSMGYRTASSGEDSFDRAVAGARRLVHGLADQSPNDSVTLCRLSRPVQPLVATAMLNSEGLRRIDANLGSIRVSQGGARAWMGLRETGRMLSHPGGSANAVVYLFTDLQRYDWADAEEATRTVETIKALGGEARMVKWVVVDVGAESPSNICVEEVVSRQGRVVAGIPARFEAVVANHGREGLRQIELGLSISGHTLPPVTIAAIGPGERVREPIEIAFPVHGSDYLQVRITSIGAASDGLELDDARSLPVNVAETVKVLVINGEPNAEGPRDEVHLLRTALRPEGRADSGNEVSVTTEDQLDSAEWSAADVAVLANVYRVSPSARRGLEEFVAEGGGLVVFAGDQVDLSDYATSLYREGAGLLPMRPLEVSLVQEGAEAVSIGSWESNLPVMRPFVEELANVLRQVQIHGYVTLEEGTSVEGESAEIGGEGTGERATATNPAIMGSAGDSASASSRPASSVRAIARLNDARETPLIVERPFGRGRVIWIGTSADQEWNDWASNFSYVPMMLELVQYAARPSGAPWEGRVGAVLDCALDASRFEGRARVRPPGYPVDPEYEIESRGQEEGTWHPRIEQTDQAGLYEVEVRGAEGRTEKRFAAINPDSAESDLTRIGAAEWSARMGSLHHEYVRDPAGLARDSADGRMELWWPLMLLAAAVLMLEQGLACWFGTRGT